MLDLCFQRVRELPSGAPRLHLDLLGGARQADEVDRLVGLGARRLDIGQGEVPWVVLADPEGTPFCAMEDRASYTDTGPIAALPLHSADPERDGDSWWWLTGWTDAPGAAPRTLRHPSLRGPLLELCPERTGKGEAKNRLHLDIRRGTGDDPDEVAAGVADRGGRELCASCRHGRDHTRRPTRVLSLARSVRFGQVARGPPPAAVGLRRLGSGGGVSVVVGRW